MIFKHLPNALTITRLVLIFPFLFKLHQGAYTYAFYIFLLAGFTDGLDGWLARSFKWQSFFGSFLDPLADKMLIVSSFISLACLGRLPWWLFVLVLLRDLTISLGVLAWFWLIRRRLDFDPTFISKINTLLQLILVTLCLFELAFFSLPNWVSIALITLTALTSSISYIDYVWTWSQRAWANPQPS